MSTTALKHPDPAQEAQAPLRFVTAASLFDGHDASINIMRRILQAGGVEVIHLGHNRSVEEIVNAALQEDAHGIAISSYQGGHVEFFKYAIDLLRERGGENIRVYGGGGGVIVPAEVRELHEYGVARIFSPEDGQSLGLQGMIQAMIDDCRAQPAASAPEGLDALRGGDRRALARFVTALEDGLVDDTLRGELQAAAAEVTQVPVLGITGTGGAGKSSLTDELIRRLRLERWRAARRPHSHERHRRSVGLHALDGDAQRRQRGAAVPSRRGRRVQGGRLRPGGRGDPGHRPGRCGDRRRG
jgi:methylmalonyl-CoA mutase